MAFEFETDEWRSAVSAMSEMDRVGADRARQDALGVIGDRDDAKDDMR